MEKIDPKKFVRYKSGAKLYDMSQSKFERLAKEAKATYKINKLVLVNTQILDEYLATDKEKVKSNGRGLNDE